MPDADARTTRTTLLRLAGVSKTFTMGEVLVQAIKNTSLEIFTGELLVMVGPSGSGKTTLLNLIGGLDSPTAGQVWFRDQDITAASAKQLTRYRRERLGFIFQFYNLVPNLTARENVMVSTQIADDPLDVDEVLAMVGLDERSDHFPSQLSGGEQQRIAIARAIAKSPDVLLCDEPTGALDITTGVVVLEAIAKVNRELGTTTAIITHNAAIAGIADRVISLADGRIVSIRENAAKRMPSELQW